MTLVTSSSCCGELAMLSPSAQVLKPRPARSPSANSGPLQVDGARKRQRQSPSPENSPLSTLQTPFSILNADRTQPFNGSKTRTSGSRRPARKSTLTQQQKNQKRQRATPTQLATLETEFNKNPTPTGPVRYRIAVEINMTERSVQIWFQNQ
jgi:hypothetical protein